VTKVDDYDATEGRELEAESSREFESEIDSELKKVLQEEKAEERGKWDQKLIALKEEGEPLGCMEDYGSEKPATSKPLELGPEHIKWLEKHTGDLPPEDLEDRPRVNGRRIYVVYTSQPAYRDDDSKTLEEVDDFYRLDGWPDEGDFDDERKECLAQEQERQEGLLTDREREAIDLLRYGFSQSEIAIKWRVSKAAVSRTMDRLWRKAPLVVQEIVDLTDGRKSKKHRALMKTLGVLQTQTIELRPRLAG